MPRSLAEARAIARCVSTGGVAPFIAPPLPLPVAHTKRPRLASKPQNRIVPNTLCPHVIASECFTKWLTPYGIAKLDSLSRLFSHDIIIRRRLCTANCVLPSTLNSYAAGLARFTKFCDDSNIPEEDRMPASESLLSHFIASRGAGSVGLGSMKTWLEGIRLWHHVNEAPWRGGAILKRTLNGAAKFSPIESIQPKRDPVTIEHLKSLRHHLDLSNSFDIAVFAVACVAFWCCCR